MDESPNGLLGSQVPIIGWDMNSPQTTKISPRSVILPRPVGQSSSSPSGVYFIEEWGTHQRNKRRIKRPPKPNLYKRYDFTSALDTPEKSDSSDFDDFSDEVLSQIRLTPLLNKTNKTCSPSTVGREVSPTEQGSSSSRTSAAPTVFKTPTMFKTNSRHSNEQTKVQPRKLTAEFDNAKSPVQWNKQPPSKQPGQQPGHQPGRQPGRQSGNRFNMTTQNSNPGHNKPGPHSKPGPSKPGPHNQHVPSNKHPVRSEPVQCKQTVTPCLDDEDMISDDDDEILRQADLVYFSQSSQHSKIQEQSTNNQSLRAQTKPLSNISKQSEQSNSKNPVCKQSNSVHESSEKSNKENVAMSDDGFSDTDSFDDLEIDDALLESINAKNAKQKEIPTPIRTPPKAPSPQHKKQRLSLSLKKKSKNR